ncbi:DUF6431 domain-containing protein [Streptomyces sp. NPDC051561]|uniref:DUF6431 domain-containing protein n=1 Tax=Streptomyces sp. NPDC051561 TaxID=3365658 RepID=UPI0037928B68
MLSPCSAGEHAPSRGGRLVLVVDADVVLMERQLRAGELMCPSCGAALAPWGHGRPREVRGDLGARFLVRPRRSRCAGCHVTHVLLPEGLWPRQRDTAEVIGAGLEIAALGMGHRQVAAHLGLSEGTVRGWFRRFRRRSEEVRRHFTVVLVALADEPVVPEASRSPLADAVSAVVAAHRAAGEKWAGVNTVSRWEFAGRVIAGGLLACASLPS